MLLPPPIRVVFAGCHEAAREATRRALCPAAGFLVVGDSGEPREALSLVCELRPELVVVGLAAPYGESLHLVEEIMRRVPTPVLVLSPRSDAEVAREAVSRGALTVLTVGAGRGLTDHDLAREAKLLAGVKVITHVKGPRACVERREEPSRDRRGAAGLGTIVAIACSTGGPQALQVLLSKLPAGFPAPIVVAQHIGDGFAEGLTQWLQSSCSLRVVAARDRETLAAGTVYVGSAAGCNVSVSGERDLAVTPAAPDQVYRPSGNLLLTSVARTAGPRSIGVILTGMGDDGVEGLGRIHAEGGATIAQDEETSVIFGMPRLAIERGFARRVLPIQAIAPELLRLTGFSEAG